MERDEAEDYAKAWARVLKHFDIRTTQKTLDIGALVIATAGVYGPRILATKLRMDMEREAQPAGPAAPNGLPAGFSYGVGAAPPH